jgi:hypothetical protein
MGLSQETMVTKLVRAYAKEAAPLHRRGARGPEQLPAGAEIMKLDDAGRARAVVEAYRILPPNQPRSRVYGECIMLGLLLTTLLKTKLPLDHADLEVMASSCAKAVSPAYGPCDYDAALVKALGRVERISPKTKVALRKLIQRRGANYAIDRRICAALEAFVER